MSSHRLLLTHRAWGFALNYVLTTEFSVCFVLRLHLSCCGVVKFLNFNKRFVCFLGLNYSEN